MAEERSNIRNRWAEMLAHDHARETAKSLVDMYSRINRPDLVNQITSCFSNAIDGDLIRPAPFGYGDRQWNDAKANAAPAGELKFGILGAGAAGLFMGMVLDYLSDQLRERYHDNAIRISYDIHEANDECRVGGRLYTHRFSDADNTHQYYDVGAMRFPNNTVMSRLFHLFDYLGMNRIENVEHATRGELIPYYFDAGEGGEQPWHFNGRTVWGRTYAELIRDAQGDYDIFGINSGGDPQLAQILRHGPDDVFAETVRYYGDRLRRDLDEGGENGWRSLLEMDKYSTRQFLLTQQRPEPVNAPVGGIPHLPYSFNSIEWLETMNGGTGWYDQAFSEAVLESLDFGYDANTRWYCILGGSQELAYKMAMSVSQNRNGKIIYNSRVTTLESDRNAMGKVHVHANYEREVRDYEYDAVFSSLPLGCLRRVDTRKLDLDYGTQQAIRSLSYGDSSKVGINFKYPWWRTVLSDNGGHNITEGGLGRSDLNIRTCVYPSYNLHDDERTPATLLCSYTWQQDAGRVASIFANEPIGNQRENDILKDLLINELARLHTNDTEHEENLRAIIRDSWQECHAFDWGRNPYSAGAFAFFGPQQFQCMWKQIIKPQGNFSIIGEAASPHHAWVVGALESAVHAIYIWIGQKNWSPQ